MCLMEERDIRKKNGDRVADGVTEIESKKNSGLGWRDGWTLTFRR